MFRRSITYRRARWISAKGSPSSGDNLDTSIQEFFESRRTVKERSLDYAGTLLFLNRLERGRRTPLRPSLLGELVSVTPDRAAEVASMSLFDSPTIDIEAMDPSPGQTFVDGRLFFLCSENHVIVAGDRIRESSLVRYLNNALRPDIIPADSAVQLKRIANTSKVRAVRSHGVKSITIDAMLYNEELELIDFEEGGILARIREKLLSIVRHDLRGPESLEKINLQLC